MDVFLGTILSFGFNFAPRGWVACNGQLIAITQNTALFALLGTYYGGDGVTTFGVPDLRGRTPIHFGQGPGLSNFVMGQQAGTETVTLLTSNMPAHTHTLAITGTATVNVTANSLTGGTITNITDGGNNSFSSSGGTPNIYSEPGGSGTDKIGGISATATLGGNTGISGSTIPFASRNPYLVVNMCIATSGIYPTRN